MINRLTDTLDFHGQALGLRAERQRLIAGNIANADTPGYQARDFDFAQALREASSGNNSSSSSATDSTGIASNVMAKTAFTAMTAFGRGAAPTLRYTTNTQTPLDNNSVDMDRERAEFAANAVKYESTLRFITGNVRTMLDALKSPNQG